MLVEGSEGQAGAHSISLLALATTKIVARLKHGMQMVLAAQAVGCRPQASAAVAQSLIGMASQLQTGDGMGLLSRQPCSGRRSGNEGIWYDHTLEVCRDSPQVRHQASPQQRPCNCQAPYEGFGLCICSLTSLV